MQLETTSLLKILPREKLEINLFHVPEMHSPPLPETSALGKLEPKKKGEGGESKRHFKSQVENYVISVCLPVCLDLCMSQYLSLRFFVCLFL